MTVTPFGVAVFVGLCCLVVSVYVALWLAESWQEGDDV